MTPFPGRSGGGGKRKGFFSGLESNNRKPSPAAETLPVVACRKRIVRKQNKIKRKSATTDCLHRQRNSVMRGGALSYMTALAHSALLCRAPPSIHSVLVYLGSRSRTRHIGSSVWFRVITNDTQTMRKPTFMSELTALGTTRTEP